MSIRRAQRARNVRRDAGVVQATGAGVPAWGVLARMNAADAEALGERVGVPRAPGENLMAYKGRVYRAGDQ